MLSMRVKERYCCTQPFATNMEWMGQPKLALGFAACSLLDLGFVLAARTCAFAFGRGGLARCALYFFALDLVGDAGCVCHE